MLLRTPGVRVSLRTSVVLIAVLAVVFWAGLNVWSPTRRLGNLLRADQPVFVRREAASSLGRDIPSWEVDRAVELLVGALDDPSPRVREYAGGGLFALGPRAEAAIPRLIAVLDDEDRYVRFSAARTLGHVVAAESVKRPEAVTALEAVLEDTEVEVRLAAAETLVELGEAQRAARTLLDSSAGEDSHLRHRSQAIMRKAKDTRPFVPGLVKELRDLDGRRRDESFETLKLFAAPEVVRSALDQALASDHHEVREWAAGRLKRIDSDQ